MPLKLSRRQVLASSAAVLTATGLTPNIKCWADDNDRPQPKFSFFIVGDTHYLADKEDSGQMNAVSAATCGGLIDTLNRLPGEALPAEIGGGKVGAPKGIIHVGDVIDTGDKTGSLHEEMQVTEWKGFEADYGLTGSDGRLKYPVYEIHGNHDSPQGKGHAIDKIIARNKKRSGLKGLSANGLHYSWDWEGIHFLNLGLIVGADKKIDRKRRYAALDSLEFLIADLEKNVGKDGPPVIISHHVDIARYTGPCEDNAAGGREWDSCDVQAFHRALAGYNVLAIFYGHTHARNVFRWDGMSAKAERGIHVFNNDNGSHFASEAQAFFHVEAFEKKLIVREYQTKDRWKTGFFTPQLWTTELA